MQTQLCPCGSNNNYLECCGRFIENNELPNTPEKLMRSRYTAFTLANIDYIAATMSGNAMHDFDLASAYNFATGVKWVSLKVIDSGLNSDTIGFVKFQAKYKVNGKMEKLNEHSLFEKIENKWYYTDKV